MLPPAFGILASIALAVLAAISMLGGEQVLVNGRLPLDKSFEITAVISTIILLFAGSRGLMLRKSWADEVYLVATGMMLYALLSMAGRAAIDNQTLLLIVLLLMLLLTLFNLIVFAVFHRPVFQQTLEAAPAKDAGEAVQRPERPPRWAFIRKR